MRQEFGRTVESSFSPLSDSHPKLLGVPIDDDGGQQVQTRDAEVLTFSGAIADFALPPDPQCALQSMVGLAFVETYVNGGVKTSQVAAQKSATVDMACLSAV